MPWVVPAPLDPSHITELFKKANGDISRSGKILQVGPSSSDTQNGSGGVPPLTSPTTMTTPGYQLDNPLSISEANVDLSTQDKLRCLSLLRNVAMSALESLPTSTTTTTSSYESEVASIATKAVNAGKRLRKKSDKAQGETATISSPIAVDLSDLFLLQSGISPAPQQQAAATEKDIIPIGSGNADASVIDIESIRTTCRRMLESSPDPSTHFKALMSFLQSAMPMETSVPQPGHSWWSVGDVLTACASEDASSNTAASHTSTSTTEVIGGQQHQDDDDDDAHHAPASTRIKNLWRKVLSMFIQGLFYQDLRTCAIKVLLLRGCIDPAPFDRPASLPSAMLEILASRAAAKVLGAVYHSLHHYPLQVFVSIPDVYLSQPSDIHTRVHQVLSTGRASSSVLTSTPGLTVRRKTPSHHHPDLYEGVIERYYWSQLDHLSDLISAHSLSSKQVILGGCGVTTDPLVHLYRRLLGISVLHNDVMATLLLGSENKGGSLNTFRNHVIAPLIEATKLAIQSAMGESPVMELILPTAIQALVTVLGCTALLSAGGTGGHSDAALAAAQLIRQELVLPVMQNISIAVSDYMRREAVFGGGGGLGGVMSSYLDDDDMEGEKDGENDVDISDSVNKALKRQLTEKRRGLNNTIRSYGVQLPSPTPSSSSSASTTPTTPWGKLFTKSVDGTCTQLLRSVPAHRHLSVIMLSQWYLPLQTALSHLRGGEGEDTDTPSLSPVARFHRTTVFTFLFHTLRLIEGIQVSEDDKITSHVSSQGCAQDTKALLSSMTPKQRVDETIASIKRVFRQHQDTAARGASSSSGQLVVTDETLLAICKQIGIPTKRLGPNTSTVLKSMQHLSGDELQRHVGHELVHVTIPTCGGGTVKEEYWTVYAAEGTLYARTASQLPTAATPSTAAPPAAAPAGKRRAPAGVGAFGRVASGLSSKAAAVAASTSDPFKPVKSLQTFLAASGNAF